MAAARGGGSAARVGDWDVELGPGWDWRAIPQLLSSACIFICSGGCLGCCEKAAKHVGDLSKSLMAHAQNPTVAEEFWSTTTIEVDPADLRAPMNTSSWDLDLHGVGSSHNLGESANHGFSLWQQTRDEWTENTRLRQQPVVKQIQEPVLSWNAAYESLLGSNKPFPQPIPLHEMVDFLVDIWEQEGLYD
ncbi:uncharacterized protein LOC123443053 [Hordeum vulgare subsp. vulgare]|uniref:Gag1-like clamp domain-containing protein n=1 Tax=Hordeum vulgare subsp. vulgare TaxID=112509 RepID=A0A8I6XW15_HORVV|nr:uncharacterized protein LOC123443053 [Hordeum vulgare subsp. vulgare]KAI5005568.1 hypothetical protein ZWY2020_032811 [Hordeum vulgare]